MRFILNAHRVLFSLNYREIKWRSPKTWVAIAIILGALYAFYSVVFSGTATETPTIESTRSVQVASVSELMGGGGSLSMVAEIRSVSEAKISPEMGGRIVRVQATLGSRVSAGQVLAEIENASQRAAVLQAEGAFDAAKAMLAKVQGGTRDEQLSILESSLDSERGTAVSTLLSAYGTIDSAVEDTADQMFTGVEIGQIEFIVNTSSQQRELSLAAQRSAMSSILTRQSISAGSISKSSNLQMELAAVEKELRDARTFMDTILSALSESIPSDTIGAAEITAFKGGATAARASITGALSSVTSMQNRLEIAEKNLEQGVSGAQTEDVAGAEASVKQAQGVYNAALANLEKTILRSPISGTLNNFTIKLGDTVAPSQQVAIVSNNAALEAVMFVTEEDRNRIKVGQSVALEGGVTGTITRIAPALDPVTRRIEVKMGLPADATLTNGQSVRATIQKDENIETVTGPLSIPLTALRMTSDRTTVFTVQDGRLVSVEVVIGKLSGDSVQITSGLALETEIVVDARGLKEGLEVEVTRP